MISELLQQLVVRMHHDPMLVAQVYERPDLVGAREGISPQDVALLSAPDRRAWGADVERRDRVLEALRAEYPVSCALVELGGRERAALLSFFSSAHFHECVGRWGVQALAFADFLADLARDTEGRELSLALGACLDMERALAQVRRSPPRPGYVAESALPARLAPAPWIVVLRLCRGTLELHGGLSAWLAGGSPPDLKVLSQEEPEWLIVERGDQQGSLLIGELPVALFEAVQRAEGGTASGELQDLLREHGADPGEALEVLESMLADQLLISVSGD